MIWLDYELKRLSRIVASYSALPVVMVMTWVVFADVVGRYVLAKPIYGAHEIIQFGLLVLAFTGFAHCWNKGGHVRMDLLLDHLPPRGKAALEAIDAAAGCFVFSLLIWQTGKDLAFLTHFSESTVELRIPFWPFKTVILLGSVLFAVQLLTSSVISLADALAPPRNNTPKHTEEP